jgi:hypothetical protein
MLLLLMFQVVVSSLALARQADVDLQLHDAWGRAAYSDQRMIEKLEKTVRDNFPYGQKDESICIDVMLWVRFRARPGCSVGLYGGRRVWFR